MRIPYAPNTPADPTPENKAIYERIAARRHPGVAWVTSALSVPQRHGLPW